MSKVKIFYNHDFGTQILIDGFFGSFNLVGIEWKTNGIKKED
jgi:hypothetical protein